MSQYLDIREFLEIALPPITHQQEIELAISVRKNFIPFKHRKDLSAQERQQFRRGCSDREKLIRSNVRLVKNVTHRFESSRLETKLLLDFGLVGLITATESYDPYRINEKSGLPYKFSTHATWQILNEMSIGVAKFRVIRIPLWVVTSIATLKRVTKELQTTLGRKPKDAEIILKMPPTGKFNKPFTQERLMFLRTSQFLNDIKSIESMRVIHDEDDPFPIFQIKDSFNIWHEIELKEELELIAKVKAEEMTKKITIGAKKRRAKKRKKKRKTRNLVIKDFSKNTPVGCQLGLKMSIKKPKQKPTKSRRSRLSFLSCSSCPTEQLSLDLETSSILDRSEFDRGIRRYA